MQNVLFNYRRRVKTDDPAEQVWNDNFINPLNVISFFWQTNEENNPVLSVFLANNYPVTFGKVIGDKFVAHMEQFLRFLIEGNSTPVQRPHYNNNRETRNPNQPRTARRAIEAEVVDEEPLNQPAANWEQ